MLITRIYSAPTSNSNYFGYKVGRRTDGLQRTGATYNEKSAIYSAEVDHPRSRDECGRLPNRFIDRPYIDNVENLTEAFRDSLFVLAAVPHERLRQQYLKPLVD